MLPFAEEVGHYWQTSRSSSDTWMERAKAQVERLGGEILAEGFGSEPVTGRSAYMLGFRIGEDTFKVVWPVLPSKSGHERAARVQAATMLYHDVKAKCISSVVVGARVAFFSYLVLSDGRVASELAMPDLLQTFPKLLQGGIS